MDALKMHGSVRGSQLAVKRIARCHPWGSSGFDPVPKILVKKLHLGHYPKTDLLKQK
jgi:putative component of membrane protein insertase Oxa1/YidC/SpoIIIJ protein YidD